MQKGRKTPYYIAITSISILQKNKRILQSSLIEITEKVFLPKPNTNLQY